jgi:hypothetical protein
MAYATLTKIHHAHAEARRNTLKKSAAEEKQDG